MGFFSALFGTKKAEPQLAPQPAPQPESFQNNYDRDDAYFAAIINEANLPGFTVETAVHPNVMDSTAHPKCLPITFLIKKGGAPVLAVMVMKQNQYRAMIARGTYQVLDARGIPYIRFFRGMKNEEGYVLNRVRSFLN